MFYLLQYIDSAAPEASMKIRTDHVSDALTVLVLASPTEVDTLLWRHEAKASQALVAMRRLRDRNPETAVYTPEFTALRHELDKHESRADLLKSVFASRSGWTRAWKVVSSDGHIHSSTACTTTYVTTQFVALPQVSGMDETEIVALAGEKACTVCYRSAPVDVLKSKCRLFTADEERENEAKTAKAVEKASRAAAKAAKAITNPDGTRLNVEHVVGSLETEVSAQRAYVELTVDATAGFYVNLAAEYARDAEIILVALAHKRGTTVETQRFELTKQVIAKAKRDSSPQAVKAANKVREDYMRQTVQAD